MEETPAGAEPVDLDETISLTIPRSYHAIIHTVFYGHLQKEVEITNLSTGELIAKQSYCYMGWYTSGVIPAIDADVDVEVRMRCMNLACGTVGSASVVPLVLANEVGGSSGQTAARSYIYATQNVQPAVDQFGITIVVQAGVGPIDVGV